jgi:hypothetical protein
MCRESLFFAICLIGSACAGNHEPAGVDPLRDAGLATATDGRSADQVKAGRDGPVAPTDARLLADAGFPADAGGLAGDVASGGRATLDGSTDVSPAEPPPAGIPAGYFLQVDQPFAEASALGDFVFANPTEWRFSPADGGSLETFRASYLPPHRSPTAVAVLAGKRFASFVLDVEIMETSTKLADPHRDFCILWDVQTPSRFYYAHISAKHDPTVAHNIHVVADADRRAITLHATSGYDWGMNVWKKLRVVRDAASGAMTVSDLASGTVLLSATDKRFTDGFIGFGSIGDPGRVRNLRIWSDAATAATPDFFQHHAP